MQLYSDNVVRLYDHETGKPAEEMHRQLEEQEIAQIQAEALACEVLKQTDGWKLLSQQLTETIEDFKLKLTAEVDYEKIRRLQEAVKSYINVLMFADIKIQQAKSFDQSKAQEIPGQPE